MNNGFLESMHLSPLFAMYGQPGIPWDFYLLTFFHALFAIPVHIVLFRWRAKEGYTSYYAKDIQKAVVKN